MKYLTILFTLLIISCNPAMAAKVDVWTGAGPNACHGNCTFTGSEHMLSEERLAQLRAVQADQPEPKLMYVPDGSVIDVATYFKDGEQKAYNTATVVAVKNPEPALGWDMGDWQWVMLDDCSNPSAVTNQMISTAGIAKEPARDGNVSFTTRSAAGYGSGFSSFGSSSTNQTETFFTSSTFTEIVTIFEDTDPDPTDPGTVVTITPVPLPGSLWMLVIGYIIGFCSISVLRRLAGHT